MANRDCTRAVTLSAADPVLDAVSALGYNIGEIAAASIPAAPAECSEEGAMGTEESIIAAWYQEVPALDYTVDAQDVVGSGGFAVVFGVNVTNYATVLPRERPAAGAAKLNEAGGAGAGQHGGFVIKKFPPTTLQWASRTALRWEVAVSRMFAGCDSLHAAVGGTIHPGRNAIIMPRATETLSDFAIHFGDRAPTATDEEFAAYYGFVAWAFLQIATALETMHGAKVLHCDVKPQNILLTAPTKAEGAAALPRVSLSDFGCARLVADVERPTHVERVMGTLFYMPPESCCVSRRTLEVLRRQLRRPDLSFRPWISAKMDVFALGSSLCEVLNFGVNSLLQHFRYPQECILHLQHAVAAAQADHANEEELERAAFTVNLKTRAPKELVAVVEKCLVLNPANRASMAEVRELLTDIVLRAGSVPMATVMGEAEPYSCDVRIFAHQPTEQPQGQPLSRAELGQSLCTQTADSFNLFEELQKYVSSTAAFDRVAKGSEDVDSMDTIWERAELLRLIELALPRARTAALLQKSTLLDEMHTGQRVYEGPKGGRFFLHPGTGKPTYLPSSRAPETTDRGSADITTAATAMDDVPATAAALRQILCTQTADSLHLIEELQKYFSSMAAFRRAIKGTEYDDGMDTIRERAEHFRLIQLALPRASAEEQLQTWELIDEMHKGHPAYEGGRSFLPPPRDGQASLLAKQQSTGDD